MSHNNNKASVIAIYLGLFLMLPLTEMVAIASSIRGGENGEGVMKAKHRIKCRFDFLGIGTEGPRVILPSRTPVYTVTIRNHCPTNCKIKNLHLKCESFSSEIPVPPQIFRQVGRNNCLVNDGLPIGVTDAITFEYANHLRFNLSVASMDCIR